MGRLRFNRICTLVLCVSISLQFCGLALCSSLTPQDRQGYEETGNPRLKQNVVHEVHCSRERSRAAWKIIQEYLLPVVKRERYQLPSKCRLHPDNDVFRDQEEHKVRVDINEWKCRYCKKRFYEEKYLDKHFDNRHYDLLNMSDTKCLADICGPLHCDVVMNSGQKKSRCNPAVASKNRHLCESLANSCFPVNAGPSAGRIHEFFLRQFCDAHTCSGGRKPLSKKLKRKKNVFYICVSAIILVLVPLFYTFVYLYHRGIKSGSQELKRISRGGHKKKPS